MRRTLILAIAALAGLLVVALVLVRAPEPQHTSPAPRVTEAASPPPAASVAPPPPEPIASKPAEPSEKPAAATEKKPPDPPKPTIAALEPADAPPPAEDDTDENAEEAEPEDSGPPDIDADHATDLLADMIARQESESEGDHLPNTTAQTLKKFDQESADANWSENAEQHIEAALDAWIAALPEEAKAHLALIHIECRTSLCEVLAADNDPASQSERSSAGQEWQQAIGSLTQQPWWHELGFVDLTTQVSGADGHTLYMSFLLRETKAPAPDAPPDDAGASDGG